MLSSKGKKSLNLKSFEKVMQINVHGSIYMAKYAAVAMSKNKQVNSSRDDKGLILLTSSVAADEG